MTPDFETARLLHRERVCAQKVTETRREIARVQDELAALKRDLDKQTVELADAAREAAARLPRRSKELRRQLLKVWGDAFG